MDEMNFNPEKFKLGKPHYLCGTRLKLRSNSNCWHCYGSRSEYRTKFRELQRLSRQEAEMAQSLERQAWMRVAGKMIPRPSISPIYVAWDRMHEVMGGLKKDSDFMTWLKPEVGNALANSKG